MSEKLIVIEKDRWKKISSIINKFDIYEYKSIFKKEIVKLNEIEKIKINEFVNELIEQIKNNDEDIDFERIRWKNGIFCPWCKSKEYWLNGECKRAQLYKCKNKTCHRLFSFMSNSFLSGSNLSFHKWSVHVKCFIQKLTYTEVAGIVDVHPLTAWKNHRKILRWLVQLVYEVN